MSSDAKIGLLLGLGFIFIIAFVINGLPSFRKDASSNELTVRMVSLQNSPAALAARERRAGEVFNQIRPKQHSARVQSRPGANRDIRFEAALPGSTSSKETGRDIEVTSAVAEENRGRRVESIGERHFSAAGAGTGQSERYVVRQGDSLWRIAAQQLGDGSRYREIAELNAYILEDEDFLSVGMCLKLPPQ